MLRIGLCGLGHVAQTCHLPAMKLAGNVRVVGFVESDESISKKYGREYKYFRTLEELFRETLDAVLIATPSDTHAKICVEALGRDVSILVEKPLALNDQDAEMVREALARSSAKLFVGLNFRHARQTLRLKDLLDAGSLGMPIGFRTLFANNVLRRRTVSGYEKDRRRGGGVIFDLAYHHFDLLRYLFGAPLRSVRCSVFSRETQDDNALVELEMANGIRGNCIFSSSSYNDHIIEVFFAQGTARIDFFKSRDIYICGRKNSVTQKLLSEFKYSLSMGTLLQYSLSKNRVDSYLRQINLLQNELRGSKTALASFEDGYAALRAAEASYISNTRKSWVNLD